MVRLIQGVGGVEAAAGDTTAAGTQQDGLDDFGEESDEEDGEDAEQKILVAAGDGALHEVGDVDSLDREVAVAEEVETGPLGGEGV